MKRFPIHSFVKHKKNDYLVFQIMDELESVPPGGPSLYRCMPLKDDGWLYKYHEDDLYAVEPQEGDFENCMSTSEIIEEIRTLPPLGPKDGVEGPERGP